MRDRILNDIKEAMKSQDKFRLTVLRMVKGAMQLEEISKKRELSDDEVIGIISKQIKTRKESNVEFEKGNRMDLVEQNNQEIDLLNEYMPEQLSLEEVLAIIDRAMDEVNPTSMKEMGKVMSIVTPLVKGKADMSFINQTIRERLNNEK